MISLSSEITDSKGRRAAVGWLFIDSDCPSCTRFARRFCRMLERRGFGLARLQDPRAQALLMLANHQPLLEMRLCTAEGLHFGGADALIYLAGRIWWAWPIYALAQIPGMRLLLRAGYRAVAKRRACTSVFCNRVELNGKAPEILRGGGNLR
jgi:predicted DCC family thiol-disulfide oxidoreductase YuxK